MATPRGETGATVLSLVAKAFRCERGLATNLNLLTVAKIAMLSAQRRRRRNVASQLVRLMGDSHPGETGATARSLVAMERSLARGLVPILNQPMMGKIVQRLAPKRRRRNAARYLTLIKDHYS